MATTVIWMLIILVVLVAYLHEQYMTRKDILKLLIEIKSICYGKDRETKKGQTEETRNSGDSIQTDGAEPNNTR